MAARLLRRADDASAAGRIALDEAGAYRDDIARAVRLIERYLAEAHPGRTVASDLPGFPHDDLYMLWTYSEFYLRDANDDELPESLTELQESTPSIVANVISGVEALIDGASTALEGAVVRPR